MRRVLCFAKEDAMDTITDQVSCCGTSVQETSCCAAPATGLHPDGSKLLNVEYLYLDLTTCRRCQATDATTKEALSILSGVFDTLGYQVHLDEVEIATRELAQQYRFLSSPTIRLNGIDIEQVVKESDCADCGSLSGGSTDCRVFTYDGKDYEQPPAAMIVDGILRALFSGRTPDETPYVLPENLERFFSGVETTSSCGDSTCGCDTPQVNVTYSKGTQMTTIHVYEPAMCCNTGVCGPDPDQALVQFTADLAALTSEGAQIARHNLANDALAFTQAEPVKAFMQAAGSAGLPLTTVDDAVVLTGRYPSRDELARYAGLQAVAEPASGCCGSSYQESSSCGCGSQTSESSGCC